MNRVFFGWWLLGSLFVVYTASNGILLNTLPMFYPSLIAEFGWSEAEVTSPAAMFYFACGFVSLFSGYFLDRYSAKRIMLFGLLGIVLALVYFSQASSLIELFAIYIVFSVGLATGGLLPSMLLLTRWFVRKRGIAVGILLLAASFGGMVFPLFVPGWIEAYGWRQSIMILAGIGAVMMILPVLFFVRDFPRDLGLRSDGDEVIEDTTERDAQQIAAGPTFRDAVTSPITYLLIFTTATLWICVTSVINHQTIYLGQDLGVDFGVLGVVVSVFFASSIFGYLIFGYLSDHFKKVHILMLAIVNLGVGLLVLRFLASENKFFLYTYAIIFGIGFSGAFGMVQLIVAEFFAGQGYGRILGLFVFIDTVASAAGIRFLGDIRVGTGSYIPAFNILIIMCIVAALCVFVVMQLQKRPGSATA